MTLKPSEMCNHTLDIMHEAYLCHMSGERPCSNASSQQPIAFGDSASARHDA